MAASLSPDLGGRLKESYDTDCYQSGADGLTAESIGGNYRRNSINGARPKVTDWIFAMSNDTTNTPEQHPIDTLLAVVAGFSQEVRALTAEAEKQSVLNPFAIRSLIRLSLKQRKLTSSYEHALDQAERISNAPFQTIGVMAGGMVARRSVESLKHTIQLQYLWNCLGSVLDRKYAFSIASISLYISVISFIVSLVGLWISLI